MYIICIAYNIIYNKFFILFIKVYKLLFDKKIKKLERKMKDD